MLKQKKHYNITKSKGCRSCVTKEGSSSSCSTQSPVDIGITETHSVLHFVEAILEHSKTEQHPDDYHHQNETSAQHAYPSPTTHLCLILIFLSLPEAFLEVGFGSWFVKFIAL